MQRADEERHAVFLSCAFVLAGCRAAPARGALPADAALPPSAPRPTAAAAPVFDATSGATASLDLPPEKGSSGCNLAAFGGTDRRAFDAFDARLRSAAGSNDPSAFADLVSYPLRVNRDHRTILIRTRAELASEAPRVFTAAVRRDIAAQQGFFCRDVGLAYGAGTIWVGVVPAAGARPEGYAVSTVNVPEVDPTKTPSRTAPETKFECVAPAHTVVVDDLGGTLRYRSWRSGQPATAPPDLELERGTVTFEGTGACEHAVYAFENGDTTYEVAPVGCTDGSEPAGTTGRLTVSRRGRTLAGWICRASPPTTPSAP